MKRRDYPNLLLSKRSQHLLGVVLITVFGGILLATPLAYAQDSPPTITVVSSPFLDPLALVVSGVISDPTDPAATLGIDFEILDAEDFPSDLQVTTNSDDPAVATPILSDKGNGLWNLKIIPIGVGPATITVSVTDTGLNTATHTIQYAASAASVNPDTTRFHTGSAEASSAISAGDYMLVADNEDEVIRLYHRQQSGLPVNTFDFRDNLNLEENREVDLEASTQAGDRIYWLGSHSNNQGGNIRKTRYRLFATDLSGSEENTTLTFTGYYSGLRKGAVQGDLIEWGDSHGYDFTASASQGTGPEITGGFNIEGLTMAPNGTTAWIGFRAPLVPTLDRRLALLAPLENIDDLATGSASQAVFGEPIELDLGGRGIRSIERNAHNEYLIIAGPPRSPDSQGPDFKLYAWTGHPQCPPQALQTNLGELNAGGSFESIVELPAPLPLDGSTPIQLLVDGELQVGAPANHQKFRSELVFLSLEGNNTPPVANDQIIYLEIDQPEFITLTASDNDSDSLSYTIVNDPTQGDLSGEPPDLIYTPNPGYIGDDSFQFQVSDCLSDSNIATVSISIFDTSPPNTPPVANDQNIYLEQDQPTAITLTASDNDGDSLIYAIVSGPAHGTLSGTPPDLFYTPDPGYTGDDSFLFQVSDGQVDSNIAIVTILIFDTSLPANRVYLPLITKP